MNVASARPAVARQINLQGLSDTVEIDYDLWGIPHIYAHSMDDLFFGNGYAHAADRLWQMDAARRRALGRFAVWAGKEALSSDMLMRRLDLATVSRADYAALSPETQRMCERYAQGVNAWIDSGQLPADTGSWEKGPSAGKAGIACWSCASAASSWDRSGSNCGAPQHLPG